MLVRCSIQFSIHDGLGILSEGGTTMFPQALIGIIVALVIVGIVLWALTQFPIDPTIAKLIRVLVIVIAAIWVCYALLGLAGGGHPLIVGR